ncbi:hypothetical protein GCM10007100_20480 [Roseibacillus persicicus]|uniref:Uncharacterized protein n=2 Tax=Roseibacillus persicicus TaxID=454148 RepID=A0A918TPQ3_9BACT|nr:hypothetical protein GCM10007100_20480 [Roseibacillus persicicus]
MGLYKMAIRTTVLQDFAVFGQVRWTLPEVEGRVGEILNSRPFILFVVLFLLPWGVWLLWDKLPEGRIPLPFVERVPPSPEPDPAKYRLMIAELAEQRAGLASRYSAAGDEEERRKIEDEARVLLEGVMPALMQCWLGTPWDFNGTSETPGEGTIACGYFVSTVLRDAGFRVERFRLAQQASQNIIATFLPRSEMHIRVSTPYQDFLEEVVSRGAGVRIVGLDNHVAFLVVSKDGTVRFIHSSGARPWAVVDEAQEQAKVLQASNYRVTGNLTGNREVLRNWLTAVDWETRT